MRLSWAILFMFHPCWLFLGRVGYRSHSFLQQAEVDCFFHALEQTEDLKSFCVGGAFAFAANTYGIDGVFLFLGKIVPIFANKEMCVVRFLVNVVSLVLATVFRLVGAF